MKKIILFFAFSATAGMGYSQDLLNKAKDAANSNSAVNNLKKEAASVPNNPANGGATISAPAAANLPKSVPSMGNLDNIKETIMAKLGPSLSLTDKQKPGITGIISDYLKNKASVAPTAATDKKSYTSKMSGLHSGLLAKLKKNLTSAQYAKLLKMKPKAGDTSSPVSALFN